MFAPIARKRLHSNDLNLLEKSKMFPARFTIINYNILFSFQTVIVTIATVVLKVQVEHAMSQDGAKRKMALTVMKSHIIATKM